MVVDSSSSSKTQHTLGSLSKLRNEIQEYENTTLLKEAAPSEYVPKEQTTGSDEILKSSVNGYDTPDGGYGWVICFAAFFANFLVDGMANCFAVHLQEYKEFFKASVGGTTLANSLLCGAYALSGPAVSKLVNKHGCRAVGFAGSLVAAFGFVTSIFSPNIVAFYLMYGLIGGAGIGMMHVPAVTAIGQYFDKKRPIVMGISTCGTGVGVFALVPLAKFLNEILDWKNSHYVFAGLLLQGCVFYSLVRPLNTKNNNKSKKTAYLNSLDMQLSNSNVKVMDTNIRNPQRPISQSMVAITGYKERLNSQRRLHASEFITTTSRTHFKPAERKNVLLYSLGSIYSIPEDASQLKHKSCNSDGNQNISKGSLNDGTHQIHTVPKHVANTLARMVDIELLRNRWMLLLCVANIFGMVGYYVPIIFSTSRAIQCGVSEYNAALLLSIFGVCNTAGRLLFGVMVSCLPNMSTLLVHNISIALAGIAITLTSLCITFSSMAVTMSIYGFFFSTFVSLEPILICDLVGVDKLTNAYGILLLVRGMGTIVGPPIAGRLYDLTGNYDSTFYMAGGCILFSVAIYSLLHKHSCKKS